MNFVDTHAHIHFKDYKLDPEQVWQDAKAAGVTRMLAVGCDIESSENAIAFAAERDGVWAVVGVHPHEAAKFNNDPAAINTLKNLLRREKVVAIGEFGLDYYYENSPKEAQIQLLKLHLQLAQDYDLPVVLHIRDAYDDFWPIFDEYNGGGKALRGVVHCFTGTQANLKDSLDRDLYVALNGIMTFTKDEEQLAAAKAVPLTRLLLETDAPYLTPKPFRGTICKPEHVKTTAAFLAGLRGESVAEIAQATTKNAQKLFTLN